LVSTRNDQSKPDVHASIPALNDRLGCEGIKGDRTARKKPPDPTGVEVFDLCRHAPDKLLSGFLWNFSVTCEATGVHHFLARRLHSVIPPQMQKRHILRYQDYILLSK
jgi:hypothetical protein